MEVLQTLSLSEQVSNTLQSLTSRPGVESTLILSRKNGSIIKVAGALEDEPHHTKNGIASSSTLSPASATAEGVAATSIEDGDTGDEAMETYAEAGPTRAERLASDIFLFVSTASFLAASLESTATSLESTATSKGYDASYQNGTGYGHMQKGKTTAIAEQEVEVNPLQLLRMRSKKHEIVIFPDPNFICCVVQSMERLGR